MEKNWLSSFIYIFDLQIACCESVYMYIVNSFSNFQLICIQKNILKLDNPQKKQSTFLVRTLSPWNECEKDCDNNVSGGPGDGPWDEVGQRNSSSNEEHKFQSKWLTLWPWST